VVAISANRTFALKTHSDSLRLPYPLLSDQALKTIRSYGVLAPDKVRR
jgi:peroxiredoxin